MPSDNDKFLIDKDYKQSEYSDNIVVYGGYFYAHWGHFLMEMTGRLWYYIKNDCSKKGVKLAIAVKEGVKLTGNFKEFFELLGIKQSDIIYVEKNIKFKKVVVPENSTIITQYYTDEFMLPFYEISKKIKPYNNVNKVYFTRGSLPEKHGITIGEKNIENCFRKNGFKIFAPEKLNLYKMISLLKGAECLAGLVGTLTHNFIFANPKTKILLLNREEYLNPSQEMIRQELRQKVSYIDVFLNLLPVRPGAGPYVVGITENLAKYFKSQNMSCKAEQKKPDSKQIVEFLKCWANTYDKKRDDAFMMNKKVSDWIDLVVELYKS